LLDRKSRERERGRERKIESRDRKIYLGER
jgi:hypothetical protein